VKNKLTGMMVLVTSAWSIIKISDEADEVRSPSVGRSDQGSMLLLLLLSQNMRGMLSQIDSFPC
jgi:hypothetical protein